MKKSKFTEEQIAFALRQAETGTRVAEVCRKMGISEMTFYRWKRKYGGLGAPSLEAARRGEPAAQAPGGGPDARQTDAPGCPLKKILKPAQKRRQAIHLRDAYWMSERRACEVVRI